MNQKLQLYSRLIVEMVVILTVTFLALSPLFAGEEEGTPDLFPERHWDATEELSTSSVWESFNATHQPTVARGAKPAEKPLSKLPHDVANLATGWTAVPQEIAEVSRDRGPLAGIAWGPIKGSTRFMENVAGTLNRETLSSGSGKVFSYTF